MSDSTFVGSLAKGWLLRNRYLVIEVVDGQRPYLWVGCQDAEGQHCVGTMDLTDTKECDMRGLRALSEAVGRALYLRSRRRKP